MQGNDLEKNFNKLLNTMYVLLPHDDSDIKIACNFYHLQYS